MPYITTPAGRMFLVDEGDGPPLVFLHGYPLDHQMWDAQRRAFRDHYRVLIPDLRGFGRSELGDGPLTMDRLADDVAALLDAAGAAGPAVVCGLSMGGGVAFGFARRHADRLRGLILCDTRAAVDAQEVLANRQRLAGLVLQEGPRVIAEAMLPRLFGPQTNERQPQVVDLIRNVILAGSPRTMSYGQNCLAERPDVRPMLASMRVPTLVVCGEHDVISPPAEMEAWAAEIPGATFALIPASGHMSPMENPAAFNRVVSEFLSRLGPASAAPAGP